MPYVKTQLHPFVLGYNLGIDITAQFDDDQLAGGTPGDQIHRGVKDVSMIQFFLGTIPSLRNVVVRCKDLLHQHNMNDCYSGGLCSYGVVLLATSFLQNANQDLITKTWSTFGDDASLMAFLEFYSTY